MENNLQTERWQVNSDFSRYEVSNLGRVRNIKTGKFIKPTPNSQVGYLQVSIYHNSGKNLTRFIHRLVYHTFHDVWSSFGMQIDHINDNKLDNNLDNLRCVPARVNTAKRFKGKTQFPTGVTKTKSGRYIARIRSKHVGRVYLGTYDTPEEAHQAYLDAAARLDNPDNSFMF